jgi:diguanylate cyclase (GGDEF)-like protein
VAEAPDARDAEATLPGLLVGRGGGGLSVWRTTYGEPEAVAGAADLDEAELVSEAVGRVVAQKEGLDQPYRTRRGTRHLTAVPIYERGDVVAVFTAFRDVPLAPAERTVVHEFTATLGHVLTKLHEERSGELVLQLAQFHGVGSETTEMSQALLDLLIPELQIWGGAVLRYQGGRFRAEALGGHLPQGIEDRLRRGLIYGEGIIWEAYQSGEALYIEGYASHPQASSELAAFGIGALALVPVEAGRNSQVMVGLFDRHDRVWRASERAMLRDLVAVLRASLAQRESELRLEEMARLQRELLDTPVAEMYRRLLEVAMRLVPGSEAASLLVRGPDGLFRYAAVVGFDAAGLAAITFTLEAMEVWYGPGDPGWPTGQPRVLVSRRDHAVSDRSALTAPSAEVRRAGRVNDIVTNLCLPVLHRGEVLAILNLDAMHDPGAFGVAAVDVATGLAPFIGFLLHEAEARSRLARAARTDVLTGLQNRRAFNEQAERDIARAVRYDEPLAVLILDLSAFKRVNDRFGHTAGDEALKAVADALRTSARSGDRIYRWGGDEFAGLLSHADAEAARLAASRMAQAIATVHTPAGAMGVSIGMACVPADGADVDTLVRVADDRMFRAKARGSVMVQDDT